MPGEGIGPEMMGHLKQVYKAAAVPVDFEMIELDPSTDNYDDLYNVSSANLNIMYLCTKYSN